MTTPQTKNELDKETIKFLKIIANELINLNKRIDRVTHKDKHGDYCLYAKNCGWV